LEIWVGRSFGVHKFVSIDGALVYKKCDVTNRSWRMPRTLGSQARN